MARVWIISDNGKWRAEILDVGTNRSWYVFRCQCGEEGTDRGDFQDTIERADIHVDQHQ